MSDNANTSPPLAANPANAGTATATTERGRGLVPDTIPVLASCITRPNELCCTDSVGFRMIGSTVDGVLLADLRAMTEYGIGDFLDDAQTNVLDGLPDCFIDATIIWPGYEHLLWKAELRTRTHGHVSTKAQLAKALVGTVRKFYVLAITRTCTEPRWRIASNGNGNGINWDQFYLVGFEHVNGRLWKITLGVDLEL